MRPIEFWCLIGAVWGFVVGVAVTLAALSFINPTHGRHRDE